MRLSSVGAPVLETLKDLTRYVETSEGFDSLSAALKASHAGVIDGAWGSSGALSLAALGQRAPSTLLVVLGFARDADCWLEDLTSFSGIRPALFPAWENLPTETTLVDEIFGQRLRLLKQLAAGETPRFVVTTIQALVQPVPDRAQLAAGRKLLRVGEDIEIDGLLAWLVKHGYKRTDAVELPGEFSRRGGILDVFSVEAETPFRLEFFGDTIESIRGFSPHTQRSLGSSQTAEIMAFVRDAGFREPGTSLKLDTQNPKLSANSDHFCNYLPADAWTVLVEPEELHEQGKHYLERVADPRGLFSVPAVFQKLLCFPNVQISALPGHSVESTCHLRVESVERFSGDVTKLKSELEEAAACDHVFIACHNEAESKRLGEVLSGGPLAQTGRLHLVIGRVHDGFRILATGENTGVVVLGDHEIFHREEARQVQPRRKLEARAIDSFLDLTEGDLVVHVSHGIARYRGMQFLDKKGHTEEHLILEFQGGVRVYVPASKIELVQKYVGGSRTEPELSRLGGTGWERKKARVREAVLDLASEMIDLQARRESRPGIAFPPDSEWQAEFEAAFPYEETPDQLATMVEIKRDMQRSRPMDRLVCGDVGYGKTELAIRAAFKAIDNGRQVAVLVPTTVLAEQHYRTFSQRLAEFPFVVDMISRFRTGAEQKRILERLAAGGIDVIIGTHRLVSHDVRFKDLGLVIIDEEQRFGVEHKERLKRLRETVDVLTMTATPIPRTLHQSLLGIREISNLETPPPDRLSIETRITRFDPQLIRHAILRELNRGGQVYFVHNRVHNIRAVADKLQSIVPEARIDIAHGQMNEHELERAMLAFVRREKDILVATTIIESGLDIPNANTIFINQADMYGLADLHQLRGRVGRYKHRAYAYLLLDGERTVTPTASRRLKAIEEFTQLGAGFKIALRDLEIRGAGNILGTQQSGHIAAVGYELYCQLLENAIRQLKSQPVRVPLETTIELPWRAYLPRDYVASHQGRIEAYRRLARIRDLEKLEDFRQELRDRFGPVPEPAEWLLRLAELRLLASSWQIASVHSEQADSSSPLDVVLGYRNLSKIRKLAEREACLRIVDEASAYFRLRSDEAAPESLYTCLRHLLRLPDRSL